MILNYAPAYFETNKPKDKNNVELLIVGSNEFRTRVNRERRNKKSEVYPFSPEDSAKVVQYFIQNQKWIHLLAFTFGYNTGRRAGDYLQFTWEQLYNPSTGKFRSDISGFKEKKTGKYAVVHINSALKSVIELYLEKTKCDPAKNNYREPVFKQLCGTHSGNILTIDGHRKALKKAACDLGIEYNVGTHSARKSFGADSRMLHPDDYDSMETLQTIFNHSSSKITNRYIGLTKTNTDNYYDDIGDFYNEYIFSGKKYEGIESKPVVTIHSSDLKEIIISAYETGKNNSQNEDPMAHARAIAEILQKIEDISK